MNEMIRKHTETSVNEDDTTIDLKAGEPVGFLWIPR